MTAPLCGRPTPTGRPCRRRLISFGPRLVCPTHIRPAPTLICPHPGTPHTAKAEPLTTWRDRLAKGASE
jgi:hypothetical protein